MKFFALSPEQKLAYKMPPDRYRGYTSPGTESLAASYGQESPPDLKESYSIGPFRFEADEYHSPAKAVCLLRPEHVAGRSCRNGRYSCARTIRRWRTSPRS